MRIKLLVLAVGLAGIAAEAGAVTPVACTGRVRSFGLDMPASDREETRVYILDDERRSMMRHSPRTGAYRTLCDRAEGCRINYGSEAVVFSHGTSEAYNSVLLDRVAGTILHVENLREFSTMLFEGQCARTAMPKSETKPQF